MLHSLFLLVTSQAKPLLADSAWVDPINSPTLFPATLSVDRRVKTQEGHQRKKKREQRPTLRFECCCCSLWKSQSNSSHSYRERNNIYSHSSSHLEEFAPEWQVVEARVEVELGLDDGANADVGAKVGVEVVDLWKVHKFLTYTSVVFIRNGISCFIGDRVYE